ncbi:MAG: sugar phosphate nucleotidyltransferase [Thermotogota bacterium]
MITALIMAGGEGTRFWPLSRSHRPKQFLKLSDNQKTMLQNTVERINDLVPLERVFIATNQAYQQPIQEQLTGIPADNIIVEPYKRNNAKKKLFLLHICHIILTVCYPTGIY